MDEDGVTIALILCIPLYPLATALMLELALRSERFEERHALMGVPAAGFLLGTASVLALNRSLRFIGGAAAGGLLDAAMLFVITSIWIALDRHFWVTVFLAGSMAMIGGSRAHILLASAGSLAEVWYGVSFVPFFVVGAFTHAILRAGKPPPQPGYYHFFSTGRVLLLLLLLPILAFLSTYASVIMF